MTPILEVTAGDYFQVMALTEVDPVNILHGVYTWCAIEEVPDPQITFSGALIKKSADETTADYATGGVGTFYAVPFNTEVYDIGGWHDNSTNNTRFTVPSGVNYVRFRAQIKVDDYSQSPWSAMTPLKNGSQLNALSLAQPYSASACYISGGAIIQQMISPPLATTPGDYWEFGYFNNGDTSVTVREDSTWFSVEKAG
jgi:hypothetical protein